MVKKSGSRSKHNSTAADEGVPTRSQRQEADTEVPPAFSIGRIDIFDVGSEVPVRKQRYRLNKMRMTSRYGGAVQYVCMFIRLLQYVWCVRCSTQYTPHADERSELHDVVFL